MDKQILFQRNEKFREQYDRILLLHPELLDLADDNARAYQLVILADSVMGDICLHADKIKIEAFEVVKEQYQHLGIPLPVWLEFVHLQRMKKYANVPDSVMEKIFGSYLGAKNVTALRETVITGIAESKSEVYVPTVEDEKSLSYQAETELDKEFMILLDNCADTRHFLDDQLWPKLRLYGDAFSYLTGDSYSTFKFLIDMYHYRNGGWPSEKTPPRSFSIVKRFSDALRSLDRYGFDYVNDWCRGFGLDIQVRDVSPALTHWNDRGNAWRKFRMFKFKPDVAEKYGCQDYHHLVMDFETKTVLAYLWDAREVEFILDGDTIDWNDTHTQYNDSLDSLRISEDFEEFEASFAPFESIIQ